jgi:hypothetical protein
VLKTDIIHRKDAKVAKNISVMIFDIPGIRYASFSLRTGNLTCIIHEGDIAAGDHGWRPCA